jgi:hypothetical protein
MAKNDTSANGQDSAGVDDNQPQVISGGDPTDDATAPKPVADHADTVDSRAGTSDADPKFEEVTALPATGATPSPLNATPGMDPNVAPTVETQRTGPDAVLERAPGMTRGSAINQIELLYAELVNKAHDFDHDTSGLSPDLASFIDFVKTRKARQG